MTNKARAVVVCPGRGTYNASELGYLKRHADRRTLIDTFDRQRTALGQPTISELDGAGRHTAIHTRGDNASGLIFACSYMDFLAIARDHFEIVAVTGNSMGWYTTLACGGALDPEQGFALANAMGKRMHEDGIGGQVVHTTLDGDWRPIPGRREAFMDLLQTIPDLYLSIELGGMIVFAGTDAALKELGVRAPQGPGAFPMRLNQHAAFHSPLLEGVSRAARHALPANGFASPALPLIDGRGHIWRPHTTDTKALWDYTLGEQITRTYDFSAAIRVAVREFAPDCLIIPGPGDTLGSAVIQSLLAIRWHGWETKSDFQAEQALRRYVLAMGRSEQRRDVEV